MWADASIIRSSSALVSGSWVGTSIEQSAILGQLIRDVLASGKTVTFAIKHVAPEKDRGMETEE